MTQHQIDILDLLRRLQLMNGIDTRTLQRLATHAEVLHFRAGEPVWLAGMKAHLIFGVVHGRIKVVHANDNGHPVSLFFDPDDDEMFVCSEMMTGEDLTTSAFATEESAVLGLCLHRLREVLQGDQQLFFNLAQLLMRNQRHLLCRLCELSPSVTERHLATLLFDQAKEPKRRIGRRIAGAVFTPTIFTLRQMARWVGIDYPTVQRLACQWRDEGWVVVTEWDVHEGDGA